MNANRFLSLILLSIFFFACRQDGLQKFEVRGNALGTTYSVNYYSNLQQNFKPGFDSIFDVINSSMSTYIKGSKISRLNAGEDVNLDEHFLKVFEKSKEIYQLTGGYFDPSIGIMVNAYGFGPVATDVELNEQNIDSLMNFVGFDKFELKSNKLHIKPDQFFLDFNAIAKGYAVDVLAGYIESHNISDYFVELGGEIVASGRNMDKEQNWRFGIEKPVEDNTQRELSFAIELKNSALATSGNYRKFRIDSLSGKKFVHTINSRTGRAVKSDVLSASVIAKDCMTADAYATAFMAMGFEKAKVLIEKEKINALLIYVDSDNTIRSFMTKGLESSISEI